MFLYEKACLLKNHIIAKTNFFIPIICKTFVDFFPNRIRKFKIYVV